MKKKLNAEQKARLEKSIQDKNKILKDRKPINK